MTKKNKNLMRNKDTKKELIRLWMKAGFASSVSAQNRLVMEFTEYMQRQEEKKNG